MSQNIWISALLCMASATAGAQELSVAKATVDCGRTGFRMPITAKFEIKNKGTKDLIITDVKTDCGCTKVELPRKSIAPEEEFTLKLTYDARMLGHFVKQAAIYSNASEKPFYLQMKGVVLTEVEDYTGTYPYTMGQLMTDCDHLEFDDVNKGEHPEIVIHIMNNSGSQLRPNVLHLPAYLTALATPETVEPGRTGKVSLTLNSEKIPNLGLTQTSVYLAGDLGDKISSENELPVSVILLPDMSQFNGNAHQYAPKMELSTDQIELGLINGKIKKSEVITISNKGKTALYISSMQMFTGGLNLTLAKNELQPGEETKLKVSADYERLKASRQKPRILMITNDPDHTKVVITINVK